MALTYVKPEKISLKNHPECNEMWVRDRIVEDTSILGLGDLEIKALERTQPQGGRLDILMRDPDSDKRYEVELMLGAVNESHIIRCIEYWDVERKRYPQYDHAAVIIAEDITTRFFNVINLFNNSIPMIAIQMEALQLGDNIMLNFTKVLDEVIPGEDDEVDNVGEAVDRNYWEERGSKKSLEIVDRSFAIIRDIDKSLQLKYNRQYIGLTDQFKARNFVFFRCKRQFIRVEARITAQEDWKTRLEEAGIVPLTGNKKRIVFQLKMDELDGNLELLKDLFQACYNEYQAE